MSKNLNFWHLIPLNPRIKIFPQYKTTLKWCPQLPSTIMQKIRNFLWLVSKKRSKNRIFDTYPLNPWIKIFTNYGTTLKWCPLLPSTIMQKIRNFWWLVSEKMSKNPNFWHLIPPNPRIKIFTKYGTKFKWCPLLPSTTMHDDQFWRKCPKTPIFDT